MSKLLRVLAHSLLLLIIPRITPYTVSLSQQIIDRDLHALRRRAWGEGEGCAGRSTGYAYKNRRASRDLLVNSHLKPC